LRASNTTTILGQDTTIDLNLGQILDVLNGYVPFRGTVEYKRLSFQAEAFFFSVGGASATTVGPRDLTYVSSKLGLQQGVYDFLLRYRFGPREAAKGIPGQFTFMPYVGARLISVNMGVDVDVLLPDDEPLSRRSQELLTRLGSRDRRSSFRGKLKDLKGKQLTPEGIKEIIKTNLDLSSGDLFPDFPLPDGEMSAFQFTSPRGVSVSASQFDHLKQLGLTNSRSEISKEVTVAAPEKYNNAIGRSLTNLNSLLPSLSNQSSLALPRTGKITVAAPPLEVSNISGTSPPARQQIALPEKSVDPLQQSGVLNSRREINQRAPVPPPVRTGNTDPTPDSRKQITLPVPSFERFQQAGIINSQGQFNRRLRVVATDAPMDAAFAPDSDGRIPLSNKVFEQLLDSGVIDQKGNFNPGLIVQPPEGFKDRGSGLNPPGQITLPKPEFERLQRLGVINQLGEINRQFNIELLGEQTWLQPVVGAYASIFVTPSLMGFARLDVGGFGLAGGRDLSGNAQIGLGYALGNSTQLNLSWRYLGLSWNNGGSGSRKNGYEMDLNGIEIGMRYFF
jgi:hypothetical protein